MEAKAEYLKSTLPQLTAATWSPPPPRGVPLRHVAHAHQITLPTFSSCPPGPPLTPPHYISTKLVIHNPNNSAQNLPGVHTTFVLFNSLTGQPLTSMDATTHPLPHHMRLLPHLVVSIERGCRYSRRGRRRNHGSSLDLGSFNRQIQIKARNLVDKLKEETGFEVVCFEAKECLKAAVRIEGASGFGGVVQAVDEGECRKYRR